MSLVIEPAEKATRRQLPTRMTSPQLMAKKGGVPIVALTAHTARMAELLDPHCDVLIVGDSLAQTVYGHPSTLTATLEMMAAHAEAVVKGSAHSFVAVDLPFGTFEASPERAFESASWLMRRTGCSAIKIECGVDLAPTIQFLVRRGIPVVAHVGLRPQSVHVQGGYRARGRLAEESEQIIADAVAASDAGCCAMVIEGVLEHIAAKITEIVPCPTIGIGGSASCDGQVLVTEDMLGLHERTPRFVKRYADAIKMITQAVEEYANDVRERRFPASEHVYTMPG
jgi:3-methyl-2-oxobutanoate hydroxymethyltransferase